MQMDVNTFVNKLIDIADNYKTVYAYAVWGSPISNSLIDRKAQQYPSWYTATRVRNLKALSGKGYFGFDCVNLIKGVLWGWTGNLNHANGGATYATNGVPDTNADGLINRCYNVSTNFANIERGDVVWIKGHVGIYIGNGKVIECTPGWQNKVQYSALGNHGTISGLPTRVWTKHGKMPYIKYDGSDNMDFDKYVRYGLILKQGAKGDAVKSLQQDLIDLGYGAIMEPYGVDGSFGRSTANAVKAFQADNRLDVDGSVGPATQKVIAALIEPPCVDYEAMYNAVKAELEAANKKLSDIRQVLS